MGMSPKCHFKSAEDYFRDFIMVYRELDMNMSAFMLHTMNRQNFKTLGSNFHYRTDYVLSATVPLVSGIFCSFSGSNSIFLSAASSLLLFAMTTTSE